MMHYLLNYTTVKSGVAPLAPLDGFNTFRNTGLNKFTSSSLIIISWVPQGTVLAHYCFYVIYVDDISQNIRSHNVT